MLTALRVMTENFFSLLFPRMCIGCDRHPVDIGEEYCPSCRERLQNSPQCYIAHGKFFDVCVAPYLFGDPVAQTVITYKSNGDEYHTDIYVSKMLKAMEAYGTNFDMITWIPVHYVKKLIKGFDHSENLARQIAKRTNKKAVPLLRKTRWRPLQREMGLFEREKNVEGVYHIRKHIKVPIQSLRILLVDDVITTGSTMEEASKALVYAGASSVTCVALATGKVNAKIESI